MNTIGVLKWSITLLAILLLIATALPFVRTDAWWVRILDFPRLQLAVLGLVLAGIMTGWRPFGDAAHGWLAGLLLLAVAVHVWHIFPYTILSRKQVLPADRPGPEVRLLIANVLQENRDSQRLLRLVAANRPDLILISEADEWWAQALAVLQRTHPHTIQQPQANTYGMSLYSRFPLHRPEVRFLTDPGIPSFRAGVEVNGQRIGFYAVHPRPPGVPKAGSGERADSGQRDAELVLIAREVQPARRPVIVAGDFNDVAWSHTTRLFQRISRLLDPRVGRGLYSTFPVPHPCLRFPLDHLFHSDHFQCADLRRLHAIGSDHFPMFVTLRLQPSAPLEQEAPPEKPSDAREATETVDEHLRETD